MSSEIERAVAAVGLRYDHENRLIANRVLRALAENGPVAVLPGGRVMRFVQTGWRHPDEDHPHARGVIAAPCDRCTPRGFLTDEEGA